MEIGSDFTTVLVNVDSLCLCFFFFFLSFFFAVVMELYPLLRIRGCETAGSISFSSFFETEPFTFASELELCAIEGEAVLTCAGTCELLCVVVKPVCCSAGKPVCPVCKVGGGGVGIRPDRSGLTSFAFLVAGSVSSANEFAVLAGSGR